MGTANGKITVLGNDSPHEPYLIDEDHPIPSSAYKKAMGEVTDHLLKAYVDGTEPAVAEHLKKAKEIEAKLTAS